MYHMDTLDGTRRLQDASVDLIVADPPYNISVADWDEIDGYMDWMRELIAEWRRVLSPSGTLYVYCSQQYMADIEMALRPLFDIQNRIVWTYDNGQRQATERFSMGYDPLFRAVPRGAKSWAFNLDDVRDGHVWDGVRTKRQPNGHLTITRSHPNGRRPLDVWNFPRLTGSNRNGHPSPKPEALSEYIIKASSNPGDLVLVPFGGSGSECVAAARLGRDFVSFELDERYIALINERLDALANGQPTQTVKLRQDPTTVRLVQERLFV